MGSQPASFRANARTKNRKRPSAQLERRPTTAHNGFPVDREPPVDRKVDRGERPASARAPGNLILDPPASASWFQRFYVRRGKRLLSVFLVLVTSPLVLVLLTPIAVVNLILFRDPRKIFFIQERVGHRGRPFRIYKFRTMYSSTSSDHFGSWRSGEEHLRVTWFGRWLRRTHLDEFPQLLNVLRGEMELIGPRPEMLEVEAWAAGEVPDFRSRTCLVPGITGLAQITQGYTGMDVDAYAQKLAVDKYYCKNLCLALDLHILMHTSIWMLGARGWKGGAVHGNGGAPSHSAAGSSNGKPWGRGPLLTDRGGPTMLPVEVGQERFVAPSERVQFEVRQDMLASGGSEAFTQLRVLHQLDGDVDERTGIVGLEAQPPPAGQQNGFGLASHAE